MDRRISMNNMTSSEEWQPLLNYRNSLLHGETGDLATPVVVNKKVYARKGKKNQVGDDDVDDM